jgi:hypothetical protein
MNQLGFELYANIRSGLTSSFALRKFYDKVLVRASPAVSLECLLGLHSRVAYQSPMENDYITLMIAI